MSIQMFLKLDGVEGESADAKHKGEIDALGWNWGLSDPTLPVGGGGGAGKVAIRNISIQKHVDLASPVLLQFAAEGKRIAAGVLTLRRATGGEFLLIKMTNVVVTSVAMTAANTANQADETITLAFEKIEFDYRPTISNVGLGPEKAFRWDIGTNRPF